MFHVRAAAALLPAPEDSAYVNLPVTGRGEGRDAQPKREGRGTQPKPAYVNWEPPAAGASLS